MEDEQWGVVQRLHPQDRALFQQAIDRAFQTGTDFEHECRLLPPDGRVRHVHAKARVLQDASGDREFIGAVSDITERRTAEDKIRRSDRELRTLVDVMPAFVEPPRLTDQSNSSARVFWTSRVFPENRGWVGGGRTRYIRKTMTEWSPPGAPDWLPGSPSSMSYAAGARMEPITGSCVAVALFVTTQGTFLSGT